MSNELDNETYQYIFHSIPSSVTEDLFSNELELKDVTPDRIVKLKELLATQKEKWLGLQAAWLLACWGEADGLRYIQWFVCEQEPLQENWFSHRLYGYDQTYEWALDGLLWYRTRMVDDELKLWGQDAAESARHQIFLPVNKIIELSNTRQFEIWKLFPRIQRKELIEYIPSIKIHLLEILKNQEFHRWKIRDAVHLLMEFDPEFVTNALAKYGKKISDFPLK
jgi:hypothetical protein